MRMRAIEKCEPGHEVAESGMHQAARPEWLVKISGWLHGASVRHRCTGAGRLHLPPDRQTRCVGQVSNFSKFLILQNEKACGQGVAWCGVFSAPCSVARTPLEQHPLIDSVFFRCQRRAARAGARGRGRWLRGVAGDGCRRPTLPGIAQCRLVGEVGSGASASSVSPAAGSATGGGDAWARAGACSGWMPTASSMSVKLCSMQRLKS
jgi:hypothetical protein